MCYRCSLCPVVVKRGTPRLVFIVKRLAPARKNSAGVVLQLRPREEIAAEIPVCVDCLHCLTTLGMTIAEVKRRRGALPVPQAPGATSTVKPPPPKLHSVPPVPTPGVSEKMVRTWRTKTGTP